MRRLLINSLKTWAFSRDVWVSGTLFSSITWLFSCQRWVSGTLFVWVSGTLFSSITWLFSCQRWVSGTLLGTLFWLAFSANLRAESAGKLAANLRTRLIAEANKILEESQVSYIYGGAKIGSSQECQACNKCLGNLTDEYLSRRRAKLCPACRRCGLDCSHFAQLVYRRAGLQMPYLTTKTMIHLDRYALLRKYHLHDLKNDVAQAEPGDLLVYRGHVALLIKKYPGDKRGDVIHATGGKDIRSPGQGVQRERRVPLASFRGPLIRVLRHKKLLGFSADRFRPVKPPTSLKQISP